MARVSGSVAINAAFKSVEPGWRAAWGALLLYAGSSFGLQVASASITGSLKGHASDPRAAMTAIMAAAPTMAVLPILLLVGLAAGLAAYGALYRAGLGREAEIGPAGLQWRAAEGRILGAGLLLFLLMISMIVIAALLVGEPMTAMGRRHLSTAEAGRAAGWIGLIILIALPLLMWASTRLSPFLAATVDREEIVILGAWRLTRNSFWPIFGATFVVGLAAAAAGIGGQMMATAIQAIEGAIVNPSPAQLAIPALIKSLAGVALMPAKIGLMTSVYRQLTDDQERTADVFS